MKGNRGTLHNDAALFFENTPSGFAIDGRVTTKKGTSEETGYYISSSDFLAQKPLEIAREHWKVESMRWMLDAVFPRIFPLFHREKRASC